MFRVKVGAVKGQDESCLGDPVDLIVLNEAGMKQDLMALLSTDTRGAADFRGSNDEEIY